jgi:hypothetical protein
MAASRSIWVSLWNTSSSAAGVAEEAGLTMALAVGVVQAGSCRAHKHLRLPRASASPWERGDQLIAETVEILPLEGSWLWVAAVAARAEEMD